MSTGLRNLLGEIAKWSSLAVVFALFIMNFDTLKTAASDMMGGSTPHSTASSHQRPAPTSNNQRHTQSPQQQNRGTNSGSRRGMPSYSGDGAPEAADYYHNTSVGSEVHLKAGRNGHFYAPVRLNGREIRAVVDTGASSVALSYDDAQAAGIFVRDSDFTLKTYTANGIARSAPVMIDRIELDGIVVYNVRGTVAEPGRLHITLLGMSFLGKLSRFEMRGRELVLHN